MTRTTSHGFRLFVGAVIRAAPRQTVLSGLVLFASGLTEGMGVLLLVPLLALVGVDAGGGTLGRLVAGIQWLFAVAGVRPTLPAVLSLYVALMGLLSLLQRLQRSLDVAVQHAFVRQVRTGVYRAMAGAQWGFLAPRRSSDALQMLGSEIERVRSAAFDLTSLIVSSILALVYFGIALRVSASMTGVVILCGAALALTMGSYVERSRALGRAWSEAAKDLFAAMTEHLASMKTAKSYGIADRYIERFETLADQELEVRMATMRTLAAMRQRLAFGVPLVLALVVYISVAILKVPAAQLLLLLFMFGRLLPRLTGLYENVQALAVSFPAYEVLAAFEERCRSAREPVVQVQEPLTLRECLRFDHVTFEYPEGRGNEVLRDVDLEIAAGRTTAIVGPSGSGKSTIVDLLTGLLTPTRGQIRVDGRAIGPEHLKSWRDQIGLVPQDTSLFHDSIRANLLWVQPEASDDDLWRALRSAAAEDFVRALPQGLDTIVGDRGSLVSGGERQRLALARALVRHPALLILDEATSSLDSENETRIQQAIDALHQQITIVIITHRLSAVRHADLIHVVDQGRVVESGSWSDLAARDHGRFRDLCRAQGLEEWSREGEPLPAV